MKRKEYLEGFLRKSGYREDAIRVFLDSYQKVQETPSEGDFEALLETYERGEATDLKALLPPCAQIARKVGVSRYTVEFLLLSLMTEHLHGLYEEEGIPDEIFYKTMMDLYYKNEECLAVYGIYGTFVGGWVIEAFDLSRVGLGRLQYELRPFRHTYSGQGVKLGPNDQVVNVHIPRDGSPLSPQAVEESFRLAEAYFAPRLDGHPVVFVCDSWLLYPGNLEIVPPHSNLRSFASFFDIIEVAISEDRMENMWRLFDTLEGNPSRLPEDSSLRRAFKRHLLSGGVTGTGFGVYVPNK